ncbi:hypothetical protein PHYPO_G00196730 [Pangasianodon hypophthalmus]|uniref:Ig-like domain-containing protein n=1 Tax=Pangasianodon hypophthalmus TaxID=310915 RepID=A0A5N5PIW9_PANHP|nr:hypothetical protein PHYPO_G00196730 [Pangasianodon hypophthalmus]
MKISASVFITECHTVGVKVFGSGTRLYVTDKQKKTPTVSVYPVSNEQANGKRVLLCQAQGMFPDLVKFTWWDPNGKEVQASQEGYELLEQRDDQEVRITSMLIVHQSKVSSYNYKCLVKHEDGEQSPTIPEAKKPVASTCSPLRKAEQQEEEQEENLTSGLFELSRSLYLFSVTYVILLVKNVLYFCTVSVLLYKRNSANKDMLRGKAR